MTNKTHTKISHKHDSGFNIRKESEKKSRRTRRCWHCSGIIMKGENYINREIRYDKTIITLSYHKHCLESIYAESDADKEVSVSHVRDDTNFADTLEQLDNLQSAYQSGEIKDIGYLINKAYLIGKRAK